MSVIKSDYARIIRLPSGLMDVLGRNGLRAYVTEEPNGGYKLFVKGHDSPTLTYDISSRQLADLTRWGSVYRNEKAYSTLTGIIRRDFDMPSSYVAASNAFGAVQMGLHGYRLDPDYHGIGTPPFRRPYYHPVHSDIFGRGGDFVAWRGRPEWHWLHLRRHEEAPVVAERHDGRMKPGEQRSGDYGFYYRGDRQQQAADALRTLTVSEQPRQLKAAERPAGQGIAYSQAITSDVYFSYEKFKEVMASHGIVIDEDKNQLTIMSAPTKVDLQYEIYPTELQRLTAGSVSGTDAVSLQERLDIINNIIGKDFDTKVTRDMLETKDLVCLELKPEVREVVEAPFIAQERRLDEQQRLAQEQARIQNEERRIALDPNAISGRQIQAVMGQRGWFQPVDGGRAMVVEEIRVDKRQQPDTVKADGTTVDVYQMTAVINGRLVVKSISADDYRKFLELDDRHRLKMFDKVFGEVRIKSTKGHEQDDVYLSNGQRLMQQRSTDIAHATSNRVDGADLTGIDEKKGFYRERTHGREVHVGDIRVEQTEVGKYKMTAVLNGVAVSHEISQKQYDRFMAVDDYHRMQLFAKVFDEVDIKSRSGKEQQRLGQDILTAMVVSESKPAQQTESMPRPDLYETKTPGFKLTPVDPQTLVAANYSQREQQQQEQQQGRSLGV